MKFPPALSWRMVVTPLFALIPALAFSCEQIPADQTIWIRLLTPVSTYTAKAGDPVRGVLTEAIACENETYFPVGTHVNGVVRSVRKVGWGIRHETAALKLEFTQLEPPEGPPVVISASVLEVENAREQVSSKGVIQGIRSSDTPEGRINSRLGHLPTWNPYSDMGLIIYKATFPIFPEPEIYFPPGADLRLKVEEPIIAPAPLPQPPVDEADYAADDFEWQEFVRTIPQRTTTTSMAEADLINVIFVGSREQVETAFHHAGWVGSDPFTRHSFMRDFYAFLNNSGYPRAPMRPFLLNGNPPDMNWQKSLNSYARRDHLRMWEWGDSPSSKTVWLSSSTHDAGAALSVKHHQFVHHISPDIDDERGKVVRDLTAAGCVQSVHMVPRPSVPNLTQNATGDPVRTDGALAVVELKDCQSPAPELAAVSPPAPYKPGNIFFRYLRRQILTFRSDIWRANIIYGAYDLGRMSVSAMKHRNAVNAFRKSAAGENAQASAHHDAATGSTPLAGSQ